VIDAPSARIVHVLGTLLFVAVLCVVAKPKQGVAASLSLAAVCLVLGVGFNLFIVGGSPLEHLTFERTSYGSFFISLGYACVVYSILRLAGVVHRGVNTGGAHDT
jgi:hypothetical protein